MKVGEYPFKKFLKVLVGKKRGNWCLVEEERKGETHIQLWSMM